MPNTAALSTSPIAIRVLPFATILALTALQGLQGGSWPFWIYLLKTIASGAIILWAWKKASELRWTISIPAVSVGISIFVLWVGLDGRYPPVPFLSSTTPSQAWNPHAVFGQDSAMAWFFVAVRILGSALVVPAVEELFYRSFAYRYIISPQFEQESLRRYVPKAFFIVAIVFGLAHREWLPGILCGISYQWLVLRRGHLGDAITAHAITNLLLGLWVAWKGAWHFW